MRPAELLLARAATWTVVGAAASPALLIVTVPPDFLAWSTLHLSAVVAGGVALIMWVGPLADDGWFATSRSVAAQRYGGAVAVIAVVTFAVGVVTLASGAALRFDPSLQFLQLISALDIAWVVATAAIGARRWWGRGAAWVVAWVVAAVCVFSIYRYLDIVGFAADGGWLVDGGEIVRLVLPFDMMAAAVAIGLLIGGTRSQRTRHPSA